MGELDVMDLRRDLGAVRGKMEAINAVSVAEKRDLSEAEQTTWDGLKAEAQFIQRQIDRADQIAGLPGVDNTGAGNADQRSLGGAAAFHQRPTPDTPEGIYCRYLRSGDFGAMAELRAYNNTDMNVTTAADGEVTVPVGMVQDIMAKRDEAALYTKLGVMRVPGRGTTVNYPIDNEADVLFLTEAESATIDQDAPAVTEKAFTLAKYAKYLTLTWELLRDEDANLIAFINNWVARGWAATHNNALVTEVLANGTAGLTLDAAAAIGAAEIPELVGKVLPEYQNGAQWLMHPTTKAYIEGLSGNNFHFAPTPSGTQQSLWGYPNNPSSYMTAFGAGVKSLVFGNFQFVGMREGTGLTSLRDPYSAATSGQVRLHYWFDLVYGVLQAEAVQYATHPTA
jgi:HK97 family phage major capsid protein